MWNYILKRLLLIIPTLIGIMIINFVVVQVAPGGPVEQAISQLSGQSGDSTDRVTQTGSDLNVSTNKDSKYRGAQGIDPELIAQLEKEYGFDKPLLERFWVMMKNYATFNFGNSFFKDKPVIDLIKEALPVSVTLGFWSTLLIYLISIPLGIRKAVNDGNSFDIISSTLLIIATAIPSFLFAIFLIIVFAGGEYFSWFPLSGLYSENYHELSAWRQFTDYLWHIILPITAITIGGFASLSMLTKNSFIDQIHQQYVITAKSKGLSENKVLYGHVFRNAMLIVIAGFPAALIGILFTGSILIEVIFSLDGLGLLGYKAAFERDYPVFFGTLFIFSLLGLIVNIISDVTYTLIDPRINFERKSI